MKNIENFEKYTRHFYEPDGGRILRPHGKGEVFTFALEPKENVAYRHFVCGEVGLFYQWKNEPDHPIVYRSIADSLSQLEAEKAAFALNFSSKKPEKYVRRVYKKLIWEPRLSYLDLSPLPTEWEAGVFVKAENLKINESLGGYLRMRIDVRYLKDGVSVHSNMNLPDETHVIAIPEGNYPYVRLSEKLTLPKGKIASVGVFIEGVGYRQLAIGRTSKGDKNAFSHFPRFGVYVSDMGGV